MTATVEKATEYGANQLSALDGLDPVRLRPGMYIGTTGKHGLHHLIWEIVDNSVDEAMAGFADKIDVIIHDDGSVSVEDNGRGIPVEPQERGAYKGMPTVQMAMTILHAGGKFGGEGSAYNRSGGLHGVGTSVVNALSCWMNVRICRDDKMYGINFHSPEEDVDGVEKIVPGKVKDPLHVIKDQVVAGMTGTFVQFLPDDEVFSSVKWDIDMISRRLRNTAYLNSGLTMTLTYKDVSEVEQYVEWNYPRGLLDFMDMISEERMEKYYETSNKSPEDEDALKPFLQSPLLLTGERAEVGEWEICTQWFPGGNTYTMDSFANGIETTDGGTHVDGFQLALTQMMNKYCRQDHIGLLTDRDPNLESSDIRSGLSVIISVKLPEPQFQGQTKGRIGNENLKPMIRSGYYDQMWEWMEEHPAEIEIVLRRCIDEMRLRHKLNDAAERERNANERQGSEPRSQNLPTKLNDCTTKDRSEAEIFIVEGKSAGGGAVTSRNSKTQAILPIRGKIFNVNEIASSSDTRQGNARNRMEANLEVQSIISALDCGSEDFCDPSKARYGKIIILADADDDGRHIQLLLMTMFFRLLRPVVEAGMLYVARTPLYGATTTKDGKVYAYDNEERDEFDAKYKNLTWTRFKGLGEMDPPVLGEMALNPNTRRLAQIVVDDSETADGIVHSLMGSDSSAKWAALSEVEVDDEEVSSL